MRIGATGLAAVQMLGSVCVTQTQPVSDACGVEVLIAGLRGYESSIESLTWEQDWYWPPNMSKARGPRAAWMIGETSSRYRDAEWVWFHESHFTSREPPDYEWKQDRAIYFGDGGTRIAAGAESEWRGVLTDQDGFFIGGCTLETLLGRGVDYGRAEAGRVLSEMLLLGRPIEYMPPTSDEPWPGVRSMNSVGNGVSTLEARMDPDQGFMPRLIRVVRPIDGAVSEIAVTLESSVVEGVHVPAVGIRIMMCRQIVDDPSTPVAEAVRGDFEIAQRLEGLPELPRATRDSLRAWVVRGQQVRTVDPGNRVAEGPHIWTSRDWGVTTPIVVVISKVRLNETRLFETSAAALPAYATLFSGYTSRRGSLGAETAVWTRWRTRVISPREVEVP